MSPAGFSSLPTTEGNTMDGYEQRKRDEKLRREREDAEYDLRRTQEQAERDKRTAEDAKRESQRLRNEAQAEREEATELIDGLQEHISEVQDELNRHRREKEATIDALRALVAALPDNTDALLKYFAGEPLVKAHREAKELLAIYDAQQKKPATKPQEE